MPWKPSSPGPGRAPAETARRGFTAAFVAVVLLLSGFALWGSDAAAQCALCGQATRYAGASPGRAVAALLAGTIVLLVPPVSVAVCVGRFLWRHRQP